jgi:hypothetical protein
MVFAKAEFIRLTVFGSEKQRYLLIDNSLQTKDVEQDSRLESLEEGSVAQQVWLQSA